MASWAVALLALVGLSAAYGETRLASGDVVVGISLPLTGEGAVYGRALRRGIQLAEAEIKSGNIAGWHPNYRVVIEDDGAKPTQALSAATKLMSLDGARLLIGGAMSSTAEALIPVTEQAGVLLISPTATKPSLTQNTRLFFRLWPSDNYDGRIMAEAAFRRFGLRRVAVLYVNSAYGDGIREVFSHEFTRLGGVITIEEPYPEGGSVFRAQLERVRASGPEAVFLPGYIKEVVRILRQSYEVGFKTRFLGVTSYYDQSLLAVGATAEGVVFTYPNYDNTSANPITSRFVSSFNARFGEQPDVFAAQGYDAFRILDLAISRSGSSDPNRVREALLKLEDYVGPGGETRFEATGDVKKQLRLITVQNGKFVGR